MITRTTVTDDDGTGTTGTIANQAWLTTFYDTLDARWSRHTSTLTGAQNNLDVDEADLVLLNGASAGAFTGLAAPASPAKPGKITIFKNIHATSVVTFAHNSGSSSAGNKFFNLATSAVTPVSTGGWIAYQYDDVNSRWNQIAHEQGAWITPTFAAGNFTAGAMTWTVESGDVTTFLYKLRGLELTVICLIVTSTLVTPAANILSISNAAYGGFTGATVKQVVGSVNDGAIVSAYVQSGASSLSLIKLSTANFTLNTNTTYIDFEATFPVT